MWIVLEEHDSHDVENEVLRRLDWFVLKLLILLRQLQDIPIQPLGWIYYKCLAYNWSKTAIDLCSDMNVT